MALMYRRREGESLEEKVKALAEDVLEQNSARVRYLKHNMFGFGEYGLDVLRLPNGIGYVLIDNSEGYPEFYLVMDGREKGSALEYIVYELLEKGLPDEAIINDEEFRKELYNKLYKILKDIPDIAPYLEELVEEKYIVHLQRIPSRNTTRKILKEIENPRLKRIVEHALDWYYYDIEVDTKTEAEKLAKIFRKHRIPVEIRKEKKYPENFLEILHCLIHEPDKEKCLEEEY